MRSRRNASKSLVLALLVLSPPAAAQELLRVIHGPLGDELWWVESMSDVDGDQVDDLVVAARSRASTAAPVYTGLSGADASVIWGPVALPNGYGAGVLRVLGDFDGDGIDDIGIGYAGIQFSGRPQEVHVVDGRTGDDIVVIDVSWDPTGGNCVGDVGDVNGDGFADVLVGGIGPRKDVHLGPDGRYAYSIVGQSDFAQLPRGLGDVTGDGKDDFAIGWQQVDLVTVHSGEDGSELYRICEVGCSTTIVSGGLGRNITPVGDIDGDAVPDFALENDRAVHPLHGAVGAIRFISGVDGTLIRTTWGKPGSDDFAEPSIGWWLGGGDDVNGDGVADVATTSFHRNDDFYAHSVVSGRTGQVVARIRVHGLAIHPTGWDKTLHDLNGDGYAEWAFVCPSCYTPTSTGQIFIFKGGPGDAETICLGATNSAGSMATLTTFGPIQHRTRELDLVVEGAVPNAFGHVVYGDEATASPFGDGDLCIDPASLRFYGTCFVTDTTGRASVHADWGRPQIAHGPGAWLPGSTWVLQAVYRDAGGSSGFTTTSALRVQFFGG